MKNKPIDLHKNQVKKFHDTLLDENQTHKLVKSSHHGWLDVSGKVLRLATASATIATVATVTLVTNGENKVSANADPATAETNSPTKEATPTKVVNSYNTYTDSHNVDSHDTTNNYYDGELKDTQQTNTNTPKQVVNNIGGAGSNIQSQASTDNTKADGSQVVNNIGGAGSGTNANSNATQDANSTAQDSHDTTAKKDDAKATSGADKQQSTASKSDAQSSNSSEAKTDAKASNGSTATQEKAKSSVTDSSLTKDATNPIAKISDVKKMSTTDKSAVAVQAGVASNATNYDLSDRMGILDRAYVENPTVSTDDLQKAIDDARKNGIVVDVKNNTTTVLQANLDSTEEQLRQHYADQVRNIRQTTTDYTNALAKANDDYEKALAHYKSEIAKLPNPTGIDPNTIKNNISLPGQGEYNGDNVEIKSLNQNWQAWTGYKDANSDNGWRGGSANTPSWVVRLPASWVKDGNKITVIAPKDRNNVDVNNIGTIRIKLAQPGYYLDPVTHQRTTIAYLQTSILNIGNNDRNHYRDGFGGHYQNLLYDGETGLTGSWGIDQYTSNDAFLDENGNAINFKHGGGYLNDLNQRMNQIDTNGAVLDWEHPTNPDTNFYWNGPKEWDNWTRASNTIFYGTASRWDAGAEGHSYLGSSVYKHIDGFYYSDDSNMTIWNAGSPMNGHLASSDPNSKAYNQTTNHHATAEFAASGAMLNDSNWTHTAKLLDNSQNSFGNLGYIYNAHIPTDTVSITPFPKKVEVPIPRLQADTTVLDLVIPTPKKNVADDKGVNIDGKNVIDGTHLDYNVDFDLQKLKGYNPSSDEVAKGLSITDNYDPKTTADQGTLKVFDASGKDITDQTTASWQADKHQVTVSAKNPADFLHTFGDQVLGVKFTATVNEGATGHVDNKATQNTFGNNNDTNTVIDHIITPKPVKGVSDDTGVNIDGKNVVAGTHLNYNVFADLNGLKDFNPDAGQVAKGLSITDNYDEKTTADQGTLKVFDASGKDITDQTTASWQADKHQVTVSAKNPVDFLHANGNQTLSIRFTATVNDSATGDVKNTASQNTFGNNAKTNTVIDHIITPKPVKSVSDDSGADIDGKNTIIGSKINYNVKMDVNGLKDFNPDKGQITKGLSVTDNYDPKTTADPSSLKVLDASGKDITNQTTASWDADKHEVTISAKDPADFLHKNGNQSLDIKFTVKVNENLTGDIKNTATQNTFGNKAKTNTVIEHVFIPVPDKKVNDLDGKDINNKNVAPGDTLNYVVGFDLTGLKGFNADSEQVAKGLSVIDTFDSKTTPNKQMVSVKDANGADISSQVNINWNDSSNTVTVSAKDPIAFVKSFGGQKLAVHLSATVNNITGKITNQASQNTFGNINKTNIVTELLPAMDPAKDVVVDAGSTASLNGKEVKLDSLFDYKLTGKRPANYGGKTNEWSVIDVAPSQDHITGQWQVFSQTEITMPDSKVVPVGTDISKYFTFNYDAGRNKVVISANQDFLDIINSDANKVHSIQWNAYFQARRVATGDSIKNTAQESYNNNIINTNTVETFTKQPKPETPATPTEINSHNTYKDSHNVDSHNVTNNYYGHKDTPKETPKTPETPATPVTPLENKVVTPRVETPATPVSSAPLMKHVSIPASPIAETASAPVEKTVKAKSETPDNKAVLPQTGENDASLGSAIGLGLVGLSATLALAGTRRKRENA